VGHPVYILNGNYIKVNISRKCFAQQRFECGFLNFHIEECNDLYRSLSIIEKVGKNYYQDMTVI
jgi:hypothetical protein